MSEKNHITTVRRITAADVGRLAGVSQPTVSRALADENKVTPETREKVLNAVLKLGYKPNAIARSLTSQKTDIIGIVTRMHLTAFLPVLEMFTSKLQRVGKQVLLFSAEPDQQLDDVLFRVLQYQVDGIIITAASLSSKMTEVCARQGTKVLLFNRYVPGAEANAVCCDNVEGGRLLANYLLDTGHKRLGFVGGAENASTTIDRLKGFRDRLRERGVIDVPTICGEYSYEWGYQGVKSMLQGDNPCDAIFCANDIIALGAMDAIRYDLGLRIPEDVSIVGFDDIQQAAWPTYSLTTIHQPFDKMVDVGIEMLFDSLENKNSGASLRLLEGGLVERSTVRNAR